MKRIERYIYIVLIVILIGIICSVATYMIIKNNTKQDLKENNNEGNKELIVKEDSIKLNKIYNLNDKIVEEFEILLNGKKQTMNIVFNYEAEENILDDENDIKKVQYVKGQMNNKEFFYQVFNKNSFNEEMFSVNYIKSEFNENNFKIVKGKDNKNYLIIVPNNTSEYYDIELFIFNDNLEQITNSFNGYSGICDKKENMIIMSRSTHLELENNVNPWYKNTFSVNFKEGTNKGLGVKIENNKIYYLNPIIKSEIELNDVGILEEREYVLNNNKLEYKVNKTFKIINGTGQFC